MWFYVHDFTIVTGDENTNYIVLFIVSRLSAPIQLNTSGLFIAMQKTIRNAYLGILKHSWTSIVYQRANRKPFLSGHGNIWNSKVVFYNKTTCLVTTDVSTETYELLLLFSIISSWINLPKEKKTARLLNWSKLIKYREKLDIIRILLKVRKW